MSETFKFEKPEINLFASEEEARSVPSRDTPFRVAVLGDFGGRASRGEVASKKVAPVEIDRDNFDEVLGKLGVELRLRLAEGVGGSLALKFESLDDFHPDRIYERADLFRALRETRKRLGDAATFKDAAAEVRRWSAPAKQETAATRTDATQTPPASAATSSSSDLLEQMLAGSKDSSTGATEAAGDAELNHLLREIVKPHLATIDETQQSALTGAVDDAVSQSMRVILHHPDFQSLEAAWRALYFLISRAETDASLKFYVIDLTREELAADLRAEGDSRRVDLYKLFVEEATGTLGGEPWSLIVGNYTFAPTWDDAELLLLIANVARQSNAPFLAGAHPRAIGCDSVYETPDPDDWRREIGAGEDAEAWAALRAHAVAHHLGLALPRFLLRLPYGAKTEPTERFDLEEFERDREPRHEDYLWGNSAFACAHLLAEAFSREGWEMRPGEPNEIEGLPLHIYEAEGESRVKPCAEVSLGDRAAEVITDRGVMPFLSYKGGDRIALARFQSLADPPTRLAGRWS
jgi:type VI secretion system protein ImpC